MPVAWEQHASRLPVRPDILESNQESRPANRKSAQLIVLHIPASSRYPVLLPDLGLAMYIPGFKTRTYKNSIPKDHLPVGI